MQWSNSLNPKTHSPTNRAGEPEQPEPRGGNWTLHHFPRVYAAILDALDPHPTAQRAVRDALNRLESEIKNS